jgi:hypothetical protein
MRASPWRRGSSPLPTRRTGHALQRLRVAPREELWQAGGGAQAQRQSGSRCRGALDRRRLRSASLDSFRRALWLPLWTQPQDRKPSLRCSPAATRHLHRAGRQRDDAVGRAVPGPARRTPLRRDSRPQLWPGIPLGRWSAPRSSFDLPLLACAAGSCTWICPSASASLWPTSGSSWAFWTGSDRACTSTRSASSSRSCCSAAICKNAF